jgi:pyridoxal phosphate enzyme (YggS family)
LKNTAVEQDAVTVLKENLDRIESRIAAACRAAGRPRGEVAMMAVSKMHPASAIVAAEALGVRLFGENRVQEFQEKQVLLRGLAGGSQFHLIGHLQSNKVARAAEIFSSVDTLDSVALAERLNQAAAQMGRRLPVLIEVKLSREESKAGLEPDSAELGRLLERLPSSPALELFLMIWRRFGLTLRGFGCCGISWRRRIPGCLLPSFQWGCRTISRRRSRKVRPRCGLARLYLGPGFIRGDWFLEPEVRFCFLPFAKVRGPFVVVVTVFLLVHL